LLQDLEVGDAQHSEQSFLLADRHTSSLDEEAAISISRAHSRTPPTKPKASLQVAHDTSSSSQQGPDQGKRLKGLGLAGIATVFQAIMSVCAKTLGNSRLNDRHLLAMCPSLPKPAMHMARNRFLYSFTITCLIGPTDLAFHGPTIMH